MMTNMFSIFDPSTSNNYSLNWLVTLVILFLMPMNFWLVPSRLFLIFYSITNILYKSLNNSMMKKNNKFFLIIMTLFWYIMLLNLLGLNPYIFTVTSQINMSSSLSITLWMTISLFMWINNTNYMFTHMVPNGTPMMLANFMVMIETISNFIRPITLCIRLSANMISGHLLMTLLSNLMVSHTNYFIMIMPILMIMLILEFAVAIIQSYVFMLLTMLYLNE
uniref:ATP synthase subunit a n=1 Tax=Chiropterargas boueti TaxID=1827022 RepID=A0A1P8AG33_9ACAR|nr:ATP synthase F0 subunit 6 [Chiropterargas boueti]AMX74070.1 ATP synthase F0 subunit 6 [Chiropterargas boueti]AMX74083.1 ATP synthase F0 subunit 6 [Chiropterargas boueti]